MIDWDHLRSLKEDVGAEDFDEVLALFFEEVEEALTRLPKAADGTSLAEELHFLKGAALNMGFEALSLRCHEAEAHARKGSPGPFDAAEVASLYRQSRQQFLADLPSRL